MLYVKYDWEKRPTCFFVCIAVYFHDIYKGDDLNVMINLILACQRLLRVQTVVCLTTVVKKRNLELTDYTTRTKISVYIANIVCL